MIKKNISIYLLKLYDYKRILLILIFNFYIINASIHSNISSISKENI